MTDTAMSDDPKSLGLALWAMNVAEPLRDLDDWLGRVDRQLARAADEGIDLLLMPELLCMQWLSYSPASLGVTGQVAWLADQAEAALAVLRGLPARHGVALLAGSMPFRAPETGRPRNRAHLLLPDGRVVVHDKICLTPDERDPAGWLLEPGSCVTLVEWRGFRIVVLICLDVELPGIAARLAGLDVDLLLVPSMTAKPSGYHRVFACARARAVELFCAVAVVGCIGTPSAPIQMPGNHSGAGIFLPCEEAFGGNGLLAEIPAVDTTIGDGAFLVYHAVPLSAVRERRRDGAEVWPGDFDVHGLSFERSTALDQPRRP